MMANENEVIPVLNQDEDDSDLDEILELIADDENQGNPRKSTLEQQLVNFRQEWHRELGKVPHQEAGGDSRGSPTPGCVQGQKTDAASSVLGKRAAGRVKAVSTLVKGSIGTPQSEDEDEEEERDVQISSLMTESQEEKAKYLFMQGVKHERNGRMYEAVMFYKQAIQLVPDVERLVQETEGNSHTGSNQVSDDEENNNIEVEEEMDDSIDEIDALTIKLQVMTTNDLRTSCSPKTPQSATHISTLPIEVLLYIFRWVVTPNLDLRSLEQLSMVCRGFYVCSRDSEIWRKACVRMWGKMSYLMKEYVSWRDMYIQRAHPRFNGIYISRVTYIREGVPSMDRFYKPWHLVEYHRFLRVFADGTVMLVSSVDDPQSVVSKMHKNYSIPGRMMGRYCIVGDMLTAVLEKEKVFKEPDTGRIYKRHRTAQQNLPESEQSFELELAINKFGRKPNMKLEWKRYACRTKYRSTGNENIIEFDMNHQFYPFYFSRVKSYAKTAEAPL